MATKLSDLLIDDVYSSLRDLIISNALHAGQKLVDRDLAELLEVSRTPIREALGRLAMTGLVENRARRGYYVSKFSADQVKDLYEFRKMLEIHAVKLAARNAQPSHLKEFDCFLDELKLLSSEPSDHARAVKLDMEIHELIARASGNASLHQAIQNVLDKVMCFISVEISDQNSLAAAHREHWSLLQMIEKKNVEGAADLIRMHVDVAQQSLVSVLQARDEVRSAVLASTPLKRGSTDKPVPNSETQHGGRL